MRIQNHLSVIKLQKVGIDRSASDTLPTSIKMTRDIFKAAQLMFD